VPVQQHYSGLEEAVYRNITACKEIANIVRTSFGPNGESVQDRRQLLEYCPALPASISRLSCSYAACSYPRALLLGMNKMIVNHLDKLFVTNDAATIIRELEVCFPNPITIFKES
jgi:T-complex protein 1 subunit theta